MDQNHLADIADGCQDDCDHDAQDEILKHFKCFKPFQMFQTSQADLENTDCDLKKVRTTIDLDVLIVETMQIVSIS